MWRERERERRIFARSTKFLRLSFRRTRGNRVGGGGGERGEEGGEVRGRVEGERGGGEEGVGEE